MAKEISKNSSQQASQHSVEANGLVVSLISILETTAAIIKHNYQC
jgi:hypothetical protein